MSPVRAITVFDPGSRFPSLSLTGRDCHLMCEHCQARHLRGMRAVGGPQHLLSLARGLEVGGASGLLLSGGCLPNGSVPLSPFLEAVREIKETTALEINIHTGLLGREEAEALVETGADAFSVDIVQEARVIRETMHLDVDKERYRDTLSFLLDAGARRVVPHICVDLPRSSHQGETEALELVSIFDVSALVVLAFVPTRGTPHHGRRSSAERLVGFVERAVGSLDVPVLLGCMRPRGRPEVDMECARKGAAGMAVVSGRALEALREEFEVTREEKCCALYR